MEVPIMSGHLQCFRKSLMQMFSYTIGNNLQTNTSETTGQALHHLAGQRGWTCGHRLGI